MNDENGELLVLVVFPCGCEVFGGERSWRIEVRDCDNLMELAEFTFVGPLGSLIGERTNFPVWGPGMGSRMGGLT